MKFENKRKTLWEDKWKNEEERRSNPYKPMHVQKCEDHVLSLLSKVFFFVSFYSFMSHF